MKQIICISLMTIFFSIAIYPQAIQSIFNDLDHLQNKNCQAETISGFSHSAVFLLKCEGIGGYKLELKYGSGFSMLSVISPNGQKRNIDYFENNGYGSLMSGKLEWRVRREGKQVKPIALIVAFNTIENLENLEQTSYLVVIKLTAKSVCLTDAVNPSKNQQIKARALADVSAKKPCLTTAQTTPFLNKITGEIPMLIEKLADKDETAPILAANALVKVGAKAVPFLIESLKQNKLCEFQTLAADVIRKIDAGQEIVKTTLFDVARGNCEYRLPPEKYLPDANFGSVMAQWRAASILATEIEGGIPLITKLLNEETGLYIGVQAFNSLIESISNKKRSKIEINPKIISDLKAAIPTLAKTLEIENKRLRCEYFNILQWMQESGFEELQTEAKQAMQGKTIDCPK